MNLLIIYLRRIFRPRAKGRTAAKGRIEYESSNQKDTGHGKTGTVCGHHRSAVNDAVGVHPAGRHQGNHHPHSRHLRLDLTGLEGRRRFRRTVWPDKSCGQHPHPLPDLLYLLAVLLGGKCTRQPVEPCDLLCAAHPGGHHSVFCFTCSRSLSRATPSRWQFVALSVRW